MIERFMPQFAYGWISWNLTCNAKIKMYEFIFTFCLKKIKPPFKAMTIKHFSSKFSLLHYIILDIFLGSLCCSKFYKGILLWINTFDQFLHFHENHPYCIKFSRYVLLPLYTISDCICVGYVKSKLKSVPALSFLQYLLQFRIRFIYESHQLSP